jgi:hypothetical protein
VKRHIGWFIDLYYNGQLDLDPPYQRRSVWTLKDRKFFLDTIFRNYPCPAVFLHKDIDGTSRKMMYHVVDGKQRIEIMLLSKDVAMDRIRGSRLNGKVKHVENEPT